MEVADSSETLVPINIVENGNVLIHCEDLTELDNFLDTVSNLSEQCI
jgi:hypothetical protein